jgi:hypothetical protein
MRLCLVVWVLLLVAVLPAHSSLVAYYDFDGTPAGKRTKTTSIRRKGETYHPPPPPI